MSSSSKSFRKRDTSSRRMEHRGGICGCLPEPAPSSPHVVPTMARIFFGIVVVESLLLFILSVLLYIYHHPTITMGQVYATLGIICVLAQVVYVSEAIWTENKPQLFAFHIVTALLTSFLIFQAVHNETTLGSLWMNIRWYVVGLKIAFELIYLGFALPVWRSFGFWAYKVVGGSIPMIRAYNRYRTFLTLLKLDVFGAVILLTLAKEYLLAYNSLDFILGMVSIGVSIIFAMIGWIAITHENKGMVYVFCVTSLMQPAFVAYRIYDLDIHQNQLPENVTFPQFAIIGGFTLLLRFALVSMGILCSFDFNKGLKQMVFDHEETKRLARKGIVSITNTNDDTNSNDSSSSLLSSVLISPASLTEIDPVGNMITGLGKLADKNINLGGSIRTPKSLNQPGTPSSSESQGKHSKTFFGRLAFTASTPMRWAFSPLLSPHSEVTSSPDHLHADVLDEEEDNNNNHAIHSLRNDNLYTPVTVNRVNQYRSDNRTPNDPLQRRLLIDSEENVDDYRDSKTKKTIDTNTDRSTDNNPILVTNNINSKSTASTAASLSSSNGKKASIGKKPRRPQYGYAFVDE